MFILHPYIQQLVAEPSFALMSQTSVISIYNLNGDIVYINNIFENKYGYSTQEIIGKSYTILLTDLSSFDFIKDVDQFWKNNTMWNGEVCSKTKDGTKCWMNTQLLPIRTPANEMVGYLVIAQDITELYQARENLTLQNLRLSALIESIPDAIFVKDGNSRWLIINQHAKKLFELEGIAWEGKTEMELAALHPEFQEIHQNCLASDEQAWQNACLSHMIEYIPDKNNNIREMEVRKMPIFNADGSRKTLVITASDVTERRQQEAELIHTKKVLEQTMQLAKMGGWEINLQKNTIIATGLARQLLPQVPGPLNLSWLVQEVVDGLSRHTAHSALNNAILGQSFDATFELKSGIWVRALGEPQMEAGKCIKIIGYIQDVTDTIKLNETNKHIEKKFSKLIEKSENVILLQDVEGVVLYASPAIERILGYSASEAIGQLPYAFFHPDDLPIAQERRQQVQDNPGQPFPIVVPRLRHKLGHYVEVEGTVTNLMHDPDIRAMMSSFRDVTERRQFEAKLRDKNAKLEHIAWLFSHEVRGPIATIRGISSLLNFGQPDAPINLSLIHKLQTPLDRLDEVVADIVLKTDELEMH